MPPHKTEIKAKVIWEGNCVSEANASKETQARVVLSDTGTIIVETVNWYNALGEPNWTSVSQTAIAYKEGITKALLKYVALAPVDHPPIVLKKSKAKLVPGTSRQED